MSNELNKKQLPFKPGMPMQQTGENNVAVTNQAGGNIYFNYNITQTTPAMPSFSFSPEMMIATQSFSNKYYQLLVTTEDDVFTNNVITIPSGRCLTRDFVPPEIFERCSTLSEEGQEELKKFPAIICMENTKYHGETAQGQYAIYAYIKLIRVYRNNVKISFQPLGVFPQSVLCSPHNSIYFDLNMDCAITDLNSTAWTIHKTNLFQAFRESGINHLPVPSEEIR